MHLKQPGMVEARKGRNMRNMKILACFLLTLFTRTAGGFSVELVQPGLVFQARHVWRMLTVARQNPVAQGRFSYSGLSTSSNLTGLDSVAQVRVSAPRATGWALQEGLLPTLSRF